MTTWFAPGRIEVFGKHTDYAGGNVLVAAVDRGVTVTAQPASSFRAVSAHGAAVELDPTGPCPLPPGHWGRYVHTVLRRLSADFGALAPVSLEVTSNLPLASGMSSSSALLIGVALAVADQQGLRHTDAWRQALSSDLDLAAYLACVENGSAFKELAGGDGVGTNGGSEDHAAILCGQPGKLLQFGFDPMALRATVDLPADWGFVVATSGVAAEKTGTALHDYNRCAAEVREIVARGGAGCTAPPANLQALLDARGADWVRRSVRDSPALTARLEHFLVESGTVVPEAVEAFRTADRDRLAVVAARSQAAAADLLGNQVPETSALVDSALTVGAWASTSFGAGFGGSVWALVPAGDGASFAADWLQCYAHHAPEAASGAQALPIRPSAAARPVPHRTHGDTHPLGGAAESPTPV